MAGSGQFVDPVNVEVDNDIGADVANDGTIPEFLPPSGLAVMGLEAATNKLFILRTNSLGQLIVVGGGGVFLVAGSPGTIIQAVADTAVGMGATVALPVPPAGTRRMTVQNTGPSASLVRVRQVGGAAGSGLIINQRGSVSFGGADGAIAPLEVEDVSATATTIAVVFERT